ncbi:centrosomal protein CEP57L1 isoform X2 [Salarias fasciatus]|uniref:centrosomal protein CEP57L1 isoform X2 n=1 Tax=Salarias fasciatus TaxID=181472 RepID=UPI001176A6E8|nr:centrosomal protein CEP57L1 isoform X2 [Salarias fasciatus]
METNYDQVLDSPSKNSCIGSYYQPPDKILSVARHLEFPTHPAVTSDPHMSSPSPSIDSKAVVAALKTLQEKIKKLEVERKQAEKNYRQFCLDAQKHQQVTEPAETTTTAAASRNETDSSTRKKLDSKMRSAEARCQVLEKQLVYMRRMVENAKKERNSLKQDQASLQQQTSSSCSQTQREKLEKLESECLKLKKTQTVAEMKLAILEQKLLKEEHERKLVQEKAEELQREFDVSLRLSAQTTEETKPKRTKKTKKTSKHDEPVTGSPKQVRFPFVAGTSTSPSHSVHANVQSILHMMKHHQPQLCERVSSLHRSGAKKSLQKNFPSSASAARRPESPPADQPLGSLSDLLLALQDELGQMSFEHQELVRQIDATERRDKRRDLEGELERLVTRMEEKGAQITKLRKHQQQIHKLTQSQRGAEEHYAKKPGGVKPPAPSPVTAKHRPKNGTTLQANRQLLRETQKLQSSLKQDDLCWET